MTPHLTSSSELEVDLIPASDDFDMFSSEYQAILSDFSKNTKPASQRAFTMDAIDAVGGPIGEYAFKIAGVLIPAIAAAAAAYISGRAGRKIKVKFGDVEVEAGTLEQVEQAFKLIEESRERLTQRAPVA